MLKLKHHAEDEVFTSTHIKETPSSKKKIPKQPHTSPHHHQQLPTHTDTQPTERPLASPVWVLVRNRNLHISFPRCFHVTCVSRLLTESQKDSSSRLRGETKVPSYMRAHKWEVNSSFEKTDRALSHQEAALCENLKRHTGGS